VQQTSITEHIPSLPLIARSFIISLVIVTAGISPINAGTLEREQARRIHDRLTGLPPSNSVLDQMESLILSGDAEGAAHIAMDNPAFYNITLKNYVAPWTNEEQSVFVPLNDYTATVIGIIRDGRDFREVLHGNIIYTGNASGIAAYSNNSNDHYEQLEQLGPVQGDLSDDTILVRRTQTEVSGLPNNATAGVITTRAAAKAFFKDGTNRAMFRFTLMNHLCTDLEPLKDVSRVPDRVRQDVSRSPGGDSRIYMFSCVGCHAGMDGMAGAYAYYDYNNNTEALEYTQGVVTGKHLINANNFKYGYSTTDDSWVNYWRNGQNKLLNWSNQPMTGVQIDTRNHSFGNGAKSLGVELSNSEAFASCQVKKAFRAICLHDPDDYAADRIAVNNITTSFMFDGYNMKNVFAKVADYCKEPQ
jgi:hypothetical protein